MKNIAFRSPAFAANGRIPRKHTGEGEDVSPALEWSALPDGTRELALICDDPDAPTPEPWVHWVAYKIPANVSRLDEGAKGSWLEGRNDFGRIGYSGPMPPQGHGVHHYHFRLYALDVPVAGKTGLSKKQLLMATQGHIIGEGELVGAYERR
jgi:Raf kinase inhibitor-like YbhB/YbcL family protein